MSAGDEFAREIMTRFVQQADEIFTEEALKMNDGKTISLTLEPGGPAVGKAVLKYDSEGKTLRAEIWVGNSRVAEFLKVNRPSIFG